MSFVERDLIMSVLSTDKCFEPIHVHSMKHILNDGTLFLSFFCDEFVYPCESIPLYCRIHLYNKPSYIPKLSAPSTGIFYKPRVSEFFLLFALWLDCFNINVCLLSPFFHVRTEILDNITTFIPIKNVGINEFLRT
jgi:hypothetical protein